MRADHKQALEECYRKKRGITTYTIRKVFLTEQSRRNTLRHFVRQGWLILDKERHGFMINQDKITEIRKELFGELLT